MARQLLRESALPLADIAVQCGFADQSHFTRVFSGRTGLSPGRWRRAV
jgi:AraC family transcriptional regulator